MTTEVADRYREHFPGHICTDDCVPPVHFTCMVMLHPIRADEHLYYLGVFRMNGFSLEAFAATPFHDWCRAEFPEGTHHYSWWSVPLEILEDCP